MLGAGYLFAPQPVASTLPTQHVAKVGLSTSASKLSTVVASRPPVPLITRHPVRYFLQPESPKATELCGDDG